MANPRGNLQQASGFIFEGKQMPTHLQDPSWAAMKTRFEAAVDDDERDTIKNELYEQLEMMYDDGTQVNNDSFDDLEPGQYLLGRDGKIINDLAQIGLVIDIVSINAAGEMVRQNHSKIVLVDDPSAKAFPVIQTKADALITSAVRKPENAGGRSTGVITLKVISCSVRAKVNQIATCVLYGKQTELPSISPLLVPTSVNPDAITGVASVILEDRPAGCYVKREVLSSTTGRRLGFVATRQDEAQENRVEAVDIVWDGSAAASTLASDYYAGRGAHMKEQTFSSKLGVLGDFLTELANNEALKGQVNIGAIAEGVASKLAANQLSDAAGETRQLAAPQE